MVDTPQQLPAIPPGEWNYIGTIAVPPSTGQVRMDAATQTVATHLWLNKTDAMSNDASANLASIVNGMEITLANKSDGSKWQTYAVSGTPVDGGTYVDYPVVWKRGGTAIPAQRTIMSAASVAVPVAVTGMSMQANVGTSTLKLGVGVAVTGLALQATAGTTTFRQDNRANVSGLSMQASIGTTTFRQDDHVKVVAMPCLTAHVGTVDVSGQLMIFDYFHPFEGPHLTSPGITKRQWYAGQALVGFIASKAPAANLIGKVSEYCFKVADSMIAYEQKQAAGITAPTVPRPPTPAPAAPPQSGPITVTEAEVIALRKKDAANAA